MKVSESNGCFVLFYTQLCQLTKTNLKNLDGVSRKINPTAEI